MKDQYNLGKGNIRLLLFRRFLWLSVIAVLAIMSVPFVKSIYDKIVQNKTTSRIALMQPGEIIFPELVLVSAGSFDMGEQDVQFIKNLRSEEKKYFGIPSKHVEIDRPFYISKYEITNEQFESYVWAQKLRHQAGKIQ